MMNRKKNQILLTLSVFIVLCFALSCKNPNTKLHEEAQPELFNRDTTITDYYPDKVIKSQQYFSNKKPFRTSNFYWKNGKLKESKLYGFSGNLLYKMNFFETGEVESFEGKPVFFAFSGERDSIKIGDTYDFSIHTISNDQIDVDLTIKSKTENEKKELFRRKVAENIPLISKTFNNLGFQQLIVIIEIKQASKVIEKDTSWIEFNVVR